MPRAPGQHIRQAQQRPAGPACAADSAGPVDTPVVAVVQRGILPQPVHQLVEGIALQQRGAFWHCVNVDGAAEQRTRAGWLAAWSQCTPSHRTADKQSEWRKGMQGQLACISWRSTGMLGSPIGSNASKKRVYSALHRLVGAKVESEHIEYPAGWWCGSSCSSDGSPVWQRHWKSQTYLTARSPGRCRTRRCQSRWASWSSP